MSNWEKVSSHAGRGEACPSDTVAVAVLPCGLTYCVNIGQLHQL